MSLERELTGSGPGPSGPAARGPAIARPHPPAAARPHPPATAPPHHGAQRPHEATSPRRGAGVTAGEAARLGVWARLWGGGPGGPLTGRPRRRGVALADFLAGTLIFTAAVTAFMGMTRAKFEVLGAGELRLRALTAAEEEADRLRRDGLGGLPAGPAAGDGFRRVRTFVPTEPLPGAEGVIEARALRMHEGAGHLLYEARVSLRWGGETQSGQLSLSLVLPLPDAAEGDE